MKLTKNSEQLMNFFLDKNCINHKKQSKKTESILLKLYQELLIASKYISTLKLSRGTSFYKLKLTKITSVSQIPKPQMFTTKSFPQEIREHIDKHTHFNLSYTFSLFGRVIKFNFVIEDSNPELQIDVYNGYVDTMLMWICILNEYASRDCSHELTVFLYFTSLKKNLPESNISILNQTHVNTAFTTTCPKISEIIIFRKEEWFKVFMHETFHNFALDFSDMNNEICTRHILSIFPVKSEVNLFEAYTEFWAEIMNAVFCGYFATHDKSNSAEFLSNCEFFINFERSYSFFQLVKTLDFMGLKYKDLYSKTRLSSAMRDTLYKEHTNVLSYYVINTILLNNYQGLLSWCDSNNLSLLQFKKTITNQKELCQFIEKNYKTKEFSDGVACSEKLVKKLVGMKKKHSESEELNFLMNNMRMTICELG